MATFTLTISDAIADRIKAAFGRPGSPASQAQVVNEIKAFLRQRVHTYETDQVITAKRESLEQEAW